MIILTAAQANQVRGLTVRGHALAPVPLANGTFVLPEACITDPAHAKYAAFLSALPTVLDSSIKQTDWNTIPANVASCQYKSSWLSGQSVNVVLI